MSALVLPARLLADARMFFEDRGARGHEGTAMIKSGPNGAALVVPQQRPWRGAGGGVSVEVTRGGQIELALALEAGELYVARIHSHPAEAFHSPADDANPVLTHEGALSIVVPARGSAMVWREAVIRFISSRVPVLAAGRESLVWLQHCLRVPRA